MKKIFNPYLKYLISWLVITFTVIVLVVSINSTILQNINSIRAIMYLISIFVGLLGVIFILQFIYWVLKYNRLLKDENVIMFWEYDNYYWGNNLYSYYHPTIPSNKIIYGNFDFMYVAPNIVTILYFLRDPEFLTLDHLQIYVYYYFFTIPAIVIIVYILKLPVNDYLPNITFNPFRFLYEYPRFAVITENGVFIKNKFIKWNSENLGLVAIKLIETKRPNHLLLRYISMNNGVMEIKRLKIPVPRNEQDEVNEVLQILNTQVKSPESYGYCVKNKYELDSSFDTKFHDKDDVGVKYDDFSISNKEVIFTKIKY